MLCYHRVGGPHELGVTRVAANVFHRQMAALARDGWHTLTLREYAAAVACRPAVADADARSLLLTFDDGYASLAERAYPLLADLGFTATTFLITDFIGGRNTWDARYTRHRLRHLAWDMIEHWGARGFDFASHGASHRRLTWLDDGSVHDELARSREVLRTRLGDGAGDAVAYPFGAVDARVRRIADAVGYRVGFASAGGNGADPLRLPRLPVYAWDRGAPPLVLRADGLGAAGRALARAANRCAVGTSMVMSWAERRRVDPG